MRRVSEQWRAHVLWQAGPPHSKAARRDADSATRAGASANVRKSSYRLPTREWLAFAAAALLLVLLALRQVWPADLGWQIATGRLVLHSGPPQVEQLSWLAAGRPVVEPRWLWCAALAWTWDRLGVAAVSWAVAATFVAAFAIAVSQRVPRRYPALAGALLIAAALTASQRFVARPDAVSAVMFAIFLGVLDRDRRHPDARVWWLLPLQILWANAHTLFGLGVALAALRTLAALVNGRRRDASKDSPMRAAALTLALAAVCAVNPYGVQIYRFAFRLAGELQSQLVEAYAYELLGPFSVRGGYVATAWFVALALGVLALALARRRRIDPFLALVWLFTLALAQSAIRNLLWFALASVPFAFSLLEARGPEAPARPPFRAWRPVLAMAVAGFALFESWQVATNRFFVAQHDTGRFGAGLTPHRYPEAIARATVDQLVSSRGWVAPGVFSSPIPERRPPRVYSTPHEASWLLTSGVPSGIDPRTENFTTAEAQTHLAMQNDSALTRRTMDRLGVEAIVCGLESTNWLRVLAHLDGWRLQSMDEVAGLFVRGFESAAGRVARIDSLALVLREALPVRTAGSPAAPWAAVTSATPYHVAGNALVILGRPDRAREFLQDAVALEPRSVPARLSLGSSLESSGDPAAARAQRELAVAIVPNDADALCALALQQLESREVAAARALLERAVRHHAGHARSWALLGESRLMGGDADGAIEDLERAARLEPANEQYKRRLAALRSGRSRNVPGH